MSPLQESLVDLLSGKTPEAMYDALHSRRCLSEHALRLPDEVIDFIKLHVRSTRSPGFQPPFKIEVLVRALIGSEYLDNLDNLDDNEPELTTAQRQELDRQEALARIRKLASDR